MSSIDTLTRSVRSLVGLQLVTRLVTFGLNQSLVRIASPTVYGTAAVQFELVRDTVLFLGRESIRGVVLRTRPAGLQDEKQDKQAQQAQRLNLNLILLAPVLGLLVILTLIPVYVGFLPSSTTTQPFYFASLLSYLLATILELASEPFLLGCQINLFNDFKLYEGAMSIRARAEGMGVIVRAIGTFACLYLAKRMGMHDGYALLGFAMGQALYSMVLLAVWTGLLGFRRVKLVLDGAQSLISSVVRRVVTSE